MARNIEKPSHPSVKGNLNAIIDRAGGDKAMHNLCVKEPADIVHSTNDNEQKRERLTILLKRIEDVVSPTTPCKSGCSYCCNMAVMIHKQEALIIAMAHGLELEEPNYGLEHQSGSAQRWVKKVCPFLEDHKCSIYDERPAACRLHYNISSEPQLCNLETGNTVPNLDFMGVHMAFVDLFRTIEFADIREFFPKGRNRD